MFNLTTTALASADAHPVAGRFAPVAPDDGPRGFGRDARMRLRSVVRLRGPWDLLGQLLPALGEVLVLEGDGGQRVSDAARFIDGLDASERDLTSAGLRDAQAAAGSWSEGFAVVEAGGSNLRYSLQFFNAAGVATQRIYLLDKRRILAWSRIVRCFGK